ncbi:hypothetical protein QTP70_034615, partial [Hemibagrus guttatus]
EPTKFDPTFTGPLHNRSCTDIICCILFIIVVVGYMVVGILAWLYGDPRHVLYPRNSTGMFCGLPPNQNKPNVFYFNILKCATATNVMAAALQGLQCPTTQICVSSCPSDFWSLNPLVYTAPSSDLHKYFKQELCVPSFNLNTTTLSVMDIINRELCPFFYTPTTSVLGRCLPTLGPAYNNISPNFTLPGMSSNQTVNTIKNATGDLLGSFNARDVGVRIFADFASTWQWIVLGLVIAMVVSLLFLLLLRFLAAILVWVLILGVLAVGAFGIWYCYNEYASLANSTLTYNNVGFTTNVNVYLQIRDTWLAFLIILCVVEAILLLTLIFLRTRILIAIAVIQESSKAVGYMMSTLIYPVITFVMLLVCVSYWGITALYPSPITGVCVSDYLATSGGPIYKVVALNSSQSGCSSIQGNQSCDPTMFNSSVYGSCETARCVFIKYNTEGLFQRNLFNLQLYNVVGFLWCANFVIALGQCTLAGAFASYYWAFHKPSDIPACPLVSSFMRALRYHVGSLAFGALILTLVQIVRIILEYIDHKFREVQNPCARFLTCCLKCCFWCLEKFIKFLNRNAYIMIAIYGKNFCVSAKNAFSLLMRNIIRVVVLDKVTDLLLFFGKLLVVGGVDLEKAYDRVPREELWYCMRKSGVAEKYVRVMQDMYERSRTVVRCAVGQTEEFKVEVGLHQGSALSPFLFAMVMDQLSEEVRQESPWTMMFADDIVICSESREQVEENLERWRFALERRGMKVSRSKTEYMCVNEREGSGTVRLQGEEVKKVQEFKYLGSTVQSNGECGKEVKKRVQAGVLAFYFFSGGIVIPNSSFTASSLNYYWMPIIAVVFGSYLIASGFFSVYSMCVDTLFLCFLEDLERNDGSAEKPYYMSKNLMKILNKKNKQAKK